MKTLYRLYIKTTPFTDKQKQERKQADKFLSNQNVQVVSEFRVVPDILKHLELESDDDIAEHSIRNYIQEPGFHNIHLVLTPSQWIKLGLRQSLYGQSRVVDGQIITYGSFKGRSDKLKYYSKDIQEALSEDTLGEWHEVTHGLQEVFKYHIPTTHAAFYGFAAKDSHLKKARRWVRKPYPMKLWLSFPWGKLPEQTPKRTILNKIISLLSTVVSLLKNQPTKIIHPVDEYKEHITRVYGFKSPRYSLTGRHIGTDYACPKNTPIVAPMNGKITVSGFSNILGYYCHFQYLSEQKQYTARFSHLSSAMTIGAYKQGAIIGYSGNTGDSDGPHVHIDVWNGDVDLTIINKNNWSILTVDPQKHYV